MKALFLAGLMFLSTPKAPLPKIDSLKDQLKLGCARTFAINRGIPAVRFAYDDRPPLTMEGPAAQRWIEMMDKDQLVGGAFKADPILQLFDPSRKLPSVKIIRFELGCMFVKGTKVTLLDWDAVTAWEKSPQFKRSYPSHDNFRVRLRIHREPVPGSL